MNSIRLACAWILISSVINVHFWKWELKYSFPIPNLLDHYFDHLYNTLSNPAPNLLIMVTKKVELPMEFVLFKPYQIWIILCTTAFICSKIWLTMKWISFLYELMLTIIIIWCKCFTKVVENNMLIMPVVL